MDREQAGRWISFWVGLHDLGKVSPDFQRKVPGCSSPLEAVGFRMTRSKFGQNAVGHGQVTTLTLEPILASQFAMPAKQARLIAQAVGGHHGRFMTSAQESHLKNLTLPSDPGGIGTGSWSTARTEIVEFLATVAGIGRQCEWGQLELSSAWLMALAGLTTVADWIGSMQTHFPPVGCDVNMDRYAAESKDRAETAVQSVGWSGWDTPEDPLPMTELFPFLKSSGLRPMQTVVESIKSRIEDPSLVLIEAPMGEGKTEAAMTLADQWSADRQQRGCYFALPTMATSNQMFGRVRQFLETRFGDRKQQVNLMLLHGRASMSEALQELIAEAGANEPSSVGDDRGSSEAAVVASEWFTYRKRGLLAPYGVGTIDQLLFSVLRSRHVFVRLFGLAGKTVIIDEVHAYDAYMNELLERAITWLRELGVSIILLSATLPSVTRRRLIRSFLPQGNPDAEEDSVDRASVPYPRITWVSDQTVDQHTFATALARKIGLEFCSPEVSEWGPRLKELLRDGGCAAVICNTVGHAQLVFSDLREFFEDGELDLLHARFPFDERERRESRVLSQYGKEAGTGLRTRSILVATQVIEQSLDVDFDVLLSDFAPVDLLLQRAGRLHRHIEVDGKMRRRPGPCSEPRLWVFTSQGDSAEIPDWGDSRYVYDEFTLLRSWLALRDRDHIRLPEDFEPLIEAVYSEAGDCPDPSPVVRENWEMTRAAGQSEMSLATADARQRLIRKPTAGRVESMGWLVRDDQLLEEDDTGIHLAFQALTRRVTRRSVTCACLIADGNVLMAGDGRPLNLDRKPDGATTEAVLRQCVSVSYPPLVRALEAGNECPASWQSNSHLRSVHVLRFDSGTLEADLGGCRVRLDPSLGLVFPHQLEQLGY